VKAEKRKMRRLEIYKVDGKNSMHYRWRLAGFWRVCWNFMVIQLVRVIPFLRLKNWCLRYLLGMKVGRHASVAVMVMFDIFLPHYITIGEDAVLGYNCTILCHEFLLREYRIGKVEIGPGVHIGANTTVLAGVNIGEGAVVSACSLVNHDIPPYVVAGGVPARILGSVKKEVQKD
jgi:acetyltransferase-like isoleucine patch superfamily enzyme